MLRLRVLLTALSLAIVGLAAIALHLHNELSDLKSVLQAKRSLQVERSGFIHAASTPKEDHRRLAKLGLVDWNAVTGTSGCVHVSVADADISLALNTKACNGYACPPCFGLNATPGMTRGVVVFSGCSDMYVGKQRLGSGSFVDALQQLEFINLNAHTSVAISDGASEFLIPPGANVMGACLADGTNEIHLDTSLRTFLRPGSQFELVSGAPAWSARQGHTAVTRADGAVLVMGGGPDASSVLNDVYSSADGGITWAQLVASAGWRARSNHQAVVRADGGVLVLGGQGAGFALLNDVWCSVDGGSSWVLLTSSASWARRMNHAAVVLNDGSVLLMAGVTSGGVSNDVHSSADGGTTWVTLTSSASWSRRWSPTVVVRSDGAVVLMGGFSPIAIQVVSDVYSSHDGVSWMQLTSAPAWSPRQDSAAVQRADGALLLLGGSDAAGLPLKDAYISTDGGASWVQLPTPSWDKRTSHAAVVRSDGALLVLGGAGCDTFPPCTIGDVWKSEL